MSKGSSKPSENLSESESLDSQNPTTSVSQETASSSSEEAGPSLWGQKVRRKLNQELKKQGVKESELPAPLRDDVVARSRKGKAGQIVVRALSGVQNSGAVTLARKLENELSSGREDVLEKLGAAGSGNQSIQKLIEIYEGNERFSLARAIAEAGADVATVLDSYAKGAKALGQMQAVVAVYKEMPNLMRDLLRHAIDEESDCTLCLSVGEVKARANSKKLTQQCPRCKGTGKARQASEHKNFAIQKVLEISDLLPKKGPLVNVNQGVQINHGQSGELLARMSKAADEVLYHRPSNVVDAEVLNGSEE